MKTIISNKSLFVYITHPNAEFGKLRGSEEKQLSGDPGETESRMGRGKGEGNTGRLGYREPLQEK